MISRTWLRRAHAQLDKIERERSIRKPERGKKAGAPRISVVIDEHVRVEFEGEPRYLGVSPGQGGAGLERKPLVIQMEVW